MTDASFLLNTFWRNVAGFLPAILWAILLAVVSLMSAAFVSRISWSDLTGMDKVGHLVCYLIFGLLVIYGFFRQSVRPDRAGIKMVLICILFGVLMECIQLWMHAGRQFEYPDIAANVIGVLIAYCIFIFSLKKKYYGS